MKKLLGLATAVAVLAISSVSFANIWNEAVSDTDKASNDVNNVSNTATSTVISTSESAANKAPSLIAPTENALSYNPDYKAVIDIANNSSRKNLLTGVMESEIPGGASAADATADEMKMENSSTTGAGYNDLKKDF